MGEEGKEKGTIGGKKKECIGGDVGKKKDERTVRHRDTQTQM